VNGDGKDDMVVAFDGPNNTLWIHSNGYPTNALYPKPITPLYTGQISVAVGDVNKDGKAEVFLGRLTALDKVPPVLMYDGAKTIANGLLANGKLPTPAITYPITNSIYNTGIYIAARDLSGDGIPELLAKVSTTGGYSTYVARMGPSFTSLWLNRFELPGTLPAGGPIG
jgi:hypothetical protein